MGSSAYITRKGSTKKRNVGVVEYIIRKKKKKKPAQEDDGRKNVRFQEQNRNLRSALG